MAENPKDHIVDQIYQSCEKRFAEASDKKRLAERSRDDAVQCFWGAVQIENQRIMQLIEHELGLQKR